MTTNKHTSTATETPDGVQYRCTYCGMGGVVNSLDEAAYRMSTHRRANDYLPTGLTTDR